MDAGRAKEIMESYGVTDVRYRHQAVWLEGIRNDIAEVTLLTSGKRMDVPLASLAEGENKEEYLS